MGNRHDTEALTRADWWALALLAVFTVARTVAYFVFDYVHFDSDQAISGIMAIDLSEHRAIPIVLYGQTYLLGVIAWLAAPLFAIAGPSIAALKAPFVPINVFAVSALYLVLRRSARLGVGASALASATLAVPTVVAAQSFMNASGGHIEPLLYVSVLFALRRRPIAFGLFGAFAFAHREVLGAAIVAAISVEILFSEHRRESAVRWLRAASAFAVLLAVIRWATATWSTNYGGLVAGYNPTSDLTSGLSWLIRDAGLVLGLVRHDIRDVGFTVAFAEGSFASLASVLVLACLAVVLLATGRRVIDRRIEAGVYLVLTCVILSAAFVGRAAEYDTLHVRYLFILTLLPAGLAAIALPLAEGRMTRLVVGVALGCFVTSNVVANAGYYAALGTARVPDRIGLLADVLEQQGFTLGLAPYWTAYNLTFRTGARMHVASSDVVRIPSYQAEVDADDEHSFSIDVVTCAPGREIVVRDIRVCRP